MAKKASVKSQASVTRSVPPQPPGLNRDGTAMSEAEAVRLIGGPLKEVKRVDAPLLYASSVVMMGTGNDFTIIFSRPHPIENPDGTINIGAAVGDTVAMISITPQTAKDFMLLLQANLPAWEKEFGVITTPFSRQMDIVNQKKE